MDATLTLRLARPADLTAVDDLLARSFPRLLAADYPPSVLVLAVPLIARARPALLASGRYFVVSDETGKIVGAGGYSFDAPAPDGASGAVVARLAHVRHFAADPARLRQGIAARIMAQVLEGSQAEGAIVMECLSTRTAVPFYKAMGFAVDRPVTVPLRAGIDFPAVRMWRKLAA
jgi:GNAT superfamily N-acetyltransferase